MDAVLFGDPNSGSEQMAAHCTGLVHMPVSFCFRHVEGMVTVGQMMSKVTRNQVKLTDPVSKALYTQFKQVRLSWQWLTNGNFESESLS